VERSCFPPAYDRASLLNCRLFFSLLPLIFVGCDVPNEPLPYPLTISEEGLGALHADTPFNQVNTTLSGFEFEKLSQISPDKPEIIFQMKRGKHILAHIVSDSSGKKIASIHILSPLIKNKERLGLGDCLPSNETTICTEDLCHRQNEPSLNYRIDPNQRTIREITYQKL